MHWRRLVADCKYHKATLVKPLFDSAQHCPDGLAKAYIINAPVLASLGWRLVMPFLSERASSKVSVCSVVPKELQEALGGEKGVKKMSDSVPPPP